jgi:hypothetical protein
MINMARKRSEQEAPKVMKKPKWKVGEIVPFTFLGAPTLGEIIELKKNPQHIDRWIYKLQEVGAGTIVPYVGIDGSEKWANIDTKRANLYTKSKN